MPTQGTKGRLDTLLRRMFMRRATVSARERIAERFQLITLEGPALRDAAWTPGQKVQIAMAEPFITRTYTPIEWDAPAGRARILCYAHGDGPGSTWAREVKPGDECDVFGPRSSIDPQSTSKPLAIFGDETSIGLAYALVAQNPTQSITCHFEVDDEQDDLDALQRLRLCNAALYPRRVGDAHIEQMAAAIEALAVANMRFVLTGKAGTVQRLRQSLKQAGVPTPFINTKVYWAPGKVGLD
jgi:NADPH-dependent ferric siderophore reductase